MKLSPILCSSQVHEITFTPETNKGCHPGRSSLVSESTYEAIGFQPFRVIMDKLLLFFSFTVTSDK